MNSKALREQNTISRLIKALTVYPPNTPLTLVPRVLPTKSQVKIHIFTLIQLFSEFDKTCKKRITPTGLTEGEGVEQTKECYLKEVILFFQTLKEHFEGIQKALTKEFKEMKDVFDELEAKVTQNVVDRKHDEIERKNLLDVNDNLIAECLYKDVFSVATNSKLNVARFTEMHVANTIVEARCCSKHMTRDRSQLMNFMKKFIRTVRFENDHFGAIMGYGDYVIEGILVMLDTRMQMQVGLNKTVRYFCIDNGTKFINKDLTEYYERVGIFHQKTVPRTPQQNGVVKRWNCTLVEAAQTMLIFSKAPMFLWAEAVATACYTQNRSLIHTRHNKTSYELVHNTKPDLTFFRVFGALCYPTDDSKDLGKLQPTVDIGIYVGYAPSRKGYKIYNKRT
nr:retrovirus-related Pol polyprotein from transposon TNT 1-94 [Tanacetum cinerariifolium]